MALTHRMRAMSLFASPYDTPKADWYLTKILAKLPELLLGAPSLRLVQASLTMAFLLETSGNCQRASLFASTALHMAQDLGYNEITPEQLANSPEHKELAYSFWLAFTLDAHFSLASQRTSGQRLENITTPLPSRDVLDWWAPDTDLDAQEGNLNVFAQQCSLAIIEAEAADELFSVKGRKRQPLDSTKAYQDVVGQLTDWRENMILSKLDASDVLTSMFQSDVVHVVMLEGAYFRTLYQLHATHALVGFAAKIDAFAPEALEATMELKLAPGYNDAVRFLRLAALLPQGNLSTTWASMQAILAAVCTILIGHIAENDDSLGQASEHLKLCDEILVVLEQTAPSGSEMSFCASIQLCRQRLMQAQVS